MPPELYADQMVRYARDLAKVYAEAERTQSELLKAMIALVEFRFPWARGHSERVAYWAQRLNEVLGRPLDPRMVYRAGILHDLGMIAVPDALVSAYFSAPPSLRLADPEHARRLMQHAELGAEALSKISEFSVIVPWVRHHHEAWNGKGWPDGLSGEAIPLGARILGVAEVFDHLFELQPGPRPSLGRVRGEMAKLSGTRLDPDLVAAFLRLPLEELWENWLWMVENEDSSD